MLMMNVTMMDTCIEQNVRLFIHHVHDHENDGWEVNIYESKVQRGKDWGEDSISNRILSYPDAPKSRGKFPVLVGFLLCSIRT